MAEVALTREAGKNAKLAALLKDAGISSVEVSRALCISHPQTSASIPSVQFPIIAYILIFQKGYVSRATYGRLACFANNSNCQRRMLL